MSEIVKVLSEADESFDLNFTELQEIILTAGKDGTPCTHSWDGTTLTVTSASGTSSADLKGENGVGITDISMQFYISTSKSEEIGGTWTDTLPEYGIDKYLWTRYVITFTNGTIAYTASFCDSFWKAINDVDDSLRSHTSNKSNPHSVNLSHLGITASATELNYTDGVTANIQTQLDGKAPSGYGLGSTSGKEITDCNTATANGFYSLAGSPVANGPGGVLNYGNLLVMNRYSGAHITQIAFYRNWTAVRYYSESVWGAWEHVNPPMTAGVEYRTAERVDGKVVYRKLVSYTNGTKIGTLDGVATTNISHGIANFGRLVRCHARSGTYQLPYISTNGGMTTVVGADASIILRIENTEWTSREWQFDIYYTK